MFTFRNRTIRPRTNRTGYIRDISVWVIDQRLGKGSNLESHARYTGNSIRWTNSEFERAAANERSRGSDSLRLDAGSATMMRVEEILSDQKVGPNSFYGLRFIVIPGLSLDVLWIRLRGSDKLAIVNAPERLSGFFWPNKILSEAEFFSALLECRGEVRTMPPLQAPSIERRLKRLLARAARIVGRAHAALPVEQVGYAKARVSIRGWGALTLILVCGIIGFGIYVQQFVFFVALTGEKAPYANLTGAWAVSEFGLVAFFMIAGMLSRKRLDGVLIDGARNRLSLSRFQLALWFVLIFGAYLTEAAWNLGRRLPLPVAGEDLRSLLGIVTVAPVVSSLVLNPKANTATPPDPETLAARSQGFTLPKPQPPPGQDAQIGSLDRNLTSSEASWSDLYLGEEVANRNDVDLSRLQQLVATIILAFIFGNMLITELSHVTGEGARMPVLDPNFEWLLGISSGAYLASKAVPKSPMQPPA